MKSRQSAPSSLGQPPQLELQLVHAAGSLVLDVEVDGGRDVQSLTRYLDDKRSLALEGVG